MNTETEDRRSTQIPVGRCPHINPHETGEMQCKYKAGHDGMCASVTGVHKGNHYFRPLPKNYDCFMAAEHNRCEDQVDRSDEFDQTRQHVHIPASLCPVADCKEWPTVAATGDCGTPRHVSPAINEFRMQQFAEILAKKERLITRLINDLAAEEEKTLVLRERVAGFERMNERLSNAVDEWLTNATSEHKAAA